MVWCVWKDFAVQGDSPDCCPKSPEVFADSFLITSHGSHDPVTSPSPDLHESGTPSHGWIETPARGRAVQDPSVRAGHAGHLTVSDPLANNQYFPLLEDLD